MGKESLGMRVISAISAASLIPMPFEIMSRIKQESTIEQPKLGDLEASATRYDSFAVWANRNDGEGCIPLGLDLNIWMRDGGGTDRSDLDIGIKVPDYSNASSIVVYCPYEIAQNELTDLWERLQNKETLHGIFNGNLTVTQNVTSSFIKIDFGGPAAGEPLLVCPVSGAIEFPPKGELRSGCLLEIDVARLVEKSGITDERGILYVRFRIPFRILDKALAASDQYRAILVSPVVDCEVSAFMKINEARSLPPSIRSNVYRMEDAVSKVYLILVLPRRWKVHDQSAYRIRNLEDGIWDAYWPHVSNCGWRAAFRRRQHFDVFQWEFEPRPRLTFRLLMERKKVNALSTAIFLAAFFGLNIAAQFVTKFILLW